MELSRTLKAMEVRFKPDLQAKLDELVKTRGMLNSRYDDLKSGRVKLIPGDEAIARLRETSAAARRIPPGS